MKTEIRAWIKGIQETIKKLETLGCIFKGFYTFTDSYYCQKNSSGDLEKEFMRLRFYKISNWDQKPVQLTHKKKASQTQNRKVMSKREFDNLSDGETFLKDTHDCLLVVSRNGWEYEINGIHIFVENIEHISASIEVIAQSKEEVMSILEYVEYTGILEHSIPATVTQQLQKCLGSASK